MSGLAAPRWLGGTRFALDVCGSTNDEAARLARAGASHGTVVVARAQTAGRGRDGRPWASPTDSGLYVSIVVRPPLPLASVPPMTLAIGVGVCDAVRPLVPSARLKWPNDLLVGDRKLAGVLVESQSQGGKLDAVIVGIGINLQGPFAPELAGIATSLADEMMPGAAITPGELLDAVCVHVEQWIDRYVAGGMEAIAPAWQARMAPNLVARTQAATGMMVGIDHDGALLVRDGRGVVHRALAGEVEIMRGGEARVLVQS